jgi:hypothetical protein
LGLLLGVTVAAGGGACDGDKKHGGLMTAGSGGHGGSPQAGTTGVGGTMASGASGGCTMASNDPALAAAALTFKEGRTTFRYDTFGSEAFWGDALKLHRAIAGEANGGVGPGVSPVTALTVLGLKVDAEALPSDLANAIASGNVDLNDPANTLALMRLNAVLGITGFFDANNKITSMGIQCALCHSTVDDSFAPGIGKRLDGWANRDLNVGAIIASAPDLSPYTNLLQVDEATVKTVLAAWGPGKFDAELALDGKGFRPDGKTAATLLPPAFGLAGVALHTWTGWGSVTHWNAFVANLEMMGKGTFHDERLNNPTKFPVAVRAGFAHVMKTPDLITPKLAQLHFYQLGLPAPPAPVGSFDATVSARGRAVFEGKAKCAGCHVPPTFSEPGWPMHTAAEIGIDDFQAKRSPDERYRTSPLAGLRTHMKGGFYHDGRFATLADVIEHYNTHFSLGLSSAEKLELAEYLKSL